jgi:hypothetical protein
MKISNASQARPPTHKATTKAANRCCRVYPSMVPTQFESSLQDGQTDHPPISMDGFSSTWVGSMLTTQCPFWACKQTLSRVRAIFVYPRSRGVTSGRRVRTDCGGGVEAVPRRCCLQLRNKMPKRRVELELPPIAARFSWRQGLLDPAKLAPVDTPRLQRGRLWHAPTPKSFKMGNAKA